VNLHSYGFGQRVYSPFGLFFGFFLFVVIVLTIILLGLRQYVLHLLL